MKYVRGSENSHEAVELHLNDGDTCVINAYLLLKCGWRQFPCGSGNDYILSDSQVNEVKELIAAERRKITRKEIKAMSDWDNSGLENFDDYFFPGDKVAEDVVDYFANVLPPITFSPRLVQAGEPYDMLPESNDPVAKWRNTYMTFTVKDGSWVYVGHCFKGDTTPRVREEILAV